LHAGASQGAVDDVLGASPLRFGEIVAALNTARTGLRLSVDMTSPFVVETEMISCATAVECPRERRASNVTLTRSAR